MKLEGVAVTHVLVVGEDGATELGSVVVASDVYEIGEELDTRLDPCEEAVRLELVRPVDGLIAVFEDTSTTALLDVTVSDCPELALTVGKILESRLVGENVKGDVDPFVVTQPQVGEKVVVEHVLCTVMVITSITSAIS